MTADIAKALCVLPLVLSPAFGGPRLVWSDDFNGSKGARPDPSKWVFDIGSGANGWGNNELESYTDSLDQVSLDGKGRLVIHAAHQGGRYLSGRIKTLGKFEFKYG